MLSYLLKVTKFLVKISQFEFLVMTEKNIFAYKFFLSLFQILIDFFGENCNPPEKSHPPFPATPSKSRVPVDPALFENLVGGPPPPSRKRGWGGICSSLF